MHKENGEGQEDRKLTGGWTITQASKPDAKPQDGPLVSGKDILKTAENQDEENSDSSGLASRSSAELILLGVFGGLFLLYGFAWIEIAKAYSLLNEQAATASGVLGAVLQNPFYWVAPTTPIAWFLGCIAFTKNLGAFRLLLMLVIGAVAVFPFPFVFAGGTL